MMTKTTKKAVWFLVGMGILCPFALYAVVYHVLPYSMIVPQRCSKEDAVRQTLPGVDIDGLLRRFESFSVTVDDSIELKGLYIRTTADQTHGTVLLLHGIGSCKEVMLGRAIDLSGRGYNCAVFDSRAHGESSGKYCTFGYYEKEDLSRVIDALRARFQDAGPIAAFGNSLGAAIILQALPYEPRIKRAIVEAPFATLPEVVNDYMRRMFYISPRWMSDVALREAGRIAQFDVDAVAPEESARLVTQPVLIVHGVRDKHIAIGYG